MTKKNLNKTLAVFMALIVVGIFMCCDHGLGMAPLSKFFVVVLGAIIGLQSAPAALLFIGMMKGHSTEAVASSKSTCCSNKTSQLKSRKVLIVDNVNSNQKKLAAFFAGSHFEVETTASAAHAIAKIVKKQAPVVVLGDEFEEQIATADVIALMRKSNEDLRIIAVSDNTSMDVLRELRESGYNQQPQKLQNQNEKLIPAMECHVDGFHPAIN